MDYKRGITREVILVGKYAFKFPSIRNWKCFLLGLIANMQEGFWYKAMGIHGKLCPVLFRIPGGFLTVMSRVDRVCTWDDDINYGEFSFYPMDPKPMNFGELNGKIVLLDYGSPGNR